MMNNLPTKIQITWSWADVQTVAPGLTERECRLVLLDLKQHHDASIGINWDVIQDAVYNRFPES